MTQNTNLQQTESPRALDPNVLQARASNPANSVWVNASAGTGKTKVLTDRVLRLLLPDPETGKGTPAHKILCITFTKAGASEMSIRIAKTLANWAVMPEEPDPNDKDKKYLKKELQDLLGRPASRQEMNAARRLFAEVMESAGGLQIMTIHAFCQSILGRFPLEAGLSPGFTVLEESQAAALLQDAKTKILTKARSEETSPLGTALTNIAQSVNEDQFFKLLLDAQKEQRAFRDILQKNFGTIDGIYTKLCSILEITPGTNPEKMLQQFCETPNPDLEIICEALASGTPKSDHPKANDIRAWLDAPPQKRAQNFERYKRLYLTSTGTIQKRLMTSGPAKKFPRALETMENEAQNILKLQDKINRITCANLSRDLFTLTSEILSEYQSRKNAGGTLDFDDLIARTADLLEGRTHPGIENMQGWVHYKLDQGLDHILIDEAQDTNPEQWKIIEALCNDFFEGLSARENTNRTVFTVGDAKQSIYSFQRASPEEFSRMRAHFAHKITESKKNWEPVDLNISFRTTPSVLKLVDHVFASETMRKGLGDLPLEHRPWRYKQAGLVELWPLCENEETETADPWEPPTTIVNAKSGSARLAENIAEQISGWINRSEILDAYNRPIKPGDIMILVRTRGPIVDQITRALKSKHIPVSGNDRMVLNDQLAVQDFLAFAEFALLASDDYTLACLLKSPLLGLNEDDLFNFCTARKTNLWNEIQKSANPEIVKYLQEVIKKSRKLSPFEFFSWLLQSPCPADEKSALRAMTARLGADALEPIEELLNAALTFESDHTPSLQNFLHWQKRSGGEIKREMEEAGNAVRIMTVHGSKGLQAPIVILPDTTRTARHVPGQNDKRMLWPDKTDLPVPLWSPRKDLDFTLFKEKFETLENRFDEEYRRLLYVAMTRAEERLYIGGYKTKKEPMAECWYNYIASSMPTLDGVEELENGALRLTNAASGNPDKTEKENTSETPDITIPDWALNPAPAEPTPPRPLVPSRPSEEEPAALSPLQSPGLERFRRGNLTHKLLQVLPDLSLDIRQAAGQTYLQKFAPDLPENIRTDILNETVAILNHPEFAPLFGPGSQAEVPVTGLIGNDNLISGQIDRLKITEDTICIIDYKTNRPPPADPAHIPAIYHSQMKAYHDALAAIYPGRTVKCALLWTDGPRLMSLSF